MSFYLVTGGAGFIGSHIIEQLLSQGDQVRVLDNLETGKIENIEPFLNKIELIKGDIRDLQTCHQACLGVDFVLHLAALGSVPRSVEDPLTTHEVNATGTLNMLIAARDAQVKRFVFSSSSAVYGDTKVLPKHEDMPPSCLSPYALSKYTGETYCSLFFKLYNLPTVALRYFNVYGPRQDPYSQYAAVIPKFVSSLLQTKAPVIYGDGEQGRDFTFVKDVVAANLLACQSSENAWGTMYNVACNKRTTINKLFQLIRSKISLTISNVEQIEPQYDPPRAGDIRDSLADIQKIQDRLGLNPKTTLQEGLDCTVEFFMNQK